MQGAPAQFQLERPLSDFLDVTHPVRLRNRLPTSTMQNVWGLLFYLQLFAQIVLITVVLTGRNVVIVADEKAACPESFHRESSIASNICFSNDLIRKFSDCALSHELGLGSGIRLENVGVSDEKLTMWQLLAKFKEVPIGVIIATFTLSTLWLLLLEKQTFCVIWATFVMNCACMCLGYYLTQNWMFLLVAACLIILAGIARDTVKLAISSMSFALKALQKKPTIIVTCFAVQFMWVIYGLLFTYAITNVSSNVNIDNVTCLPVLSSSSKVLARFGAFFAIFTTAFVSNVSLAVCCIGVGCWYFPDALRACDPPVLRPSLHGLKLSFTSSAGAVTQAALVMSIVNYAARLTHRPCWFFDPIAVMFKVLYCAFESFVSGLTRFALMAHMFQGGGFRESAKRTTSILQQRLGRAILADSVTSLIMSQIEMFLATSIGIVVWWYIDSKQNLGIFADLDKAASTGFSVGTWIVTLFIVLMLYFVRHPFVTIILVMLLNGLFTITDEYVTSFCISIYLGSIVAILFGEIANIVARSCDALYYCFALEAEAHKSQESMAELYALMNLQVLQDGAGDNRQLSAPPFA